MKIKKQQKNSGGFTLIEALFAVFILTLTITAFMGVVAQSLFSARYARDEITANYLLQEVSDYLRNDRDTLVLLSDDPNAGWNNLLIKYSACKEDDGCYFDILDTPFNPQANGAIQHYLYYHNTPESNFYNYTQVGGISTDFERQIFINQNSVNLNEINVKVIVKWENGGLSKSKLLETSLLNWQVVIP